MKRLWIFITIFFFVTAAVVIYQTADYSITHVESDTVVEDSLLTITISFVGDLMCHSPQYNYARVDKDSFDFRPVFKEVMQFFQSSDFTIGNLETVTAGKNAGYSGYPLFNTPDEYIYALKYAGFDLLVTANNHSMDQGEQGVLRTIEQIKFNGLNYTGTALDKTDRDSIRVFDLNGIKVSVLSYTYGTNNIPKPKGKDYLVNVINYGLIRNDITSARQVNPDIIIVYYHFGDEYKRFPNQYQKDVVDSTIKYGADIIIGSHPHVIQPTDYFPSINAKLDSGFIAYSLGNFISNQRWRYSDAGVILNISLTKNINSDSIFISEVKYFPTWVFKGNTQNGNEYIILPSERYDDSTYYFLSKNDRQLMKEAFEDTKYILSLYNDNIRLNEVR